MAVVFYIKQQHGKSCHKCPLQNWTHIISQPYVLLQAMAGTLFYRTSSPFSSKGDTNTISVCWRKSAKTPVTLSLHHCFFSRMNTKIDFAGANIIADGAPHDGQRRKRPETTINNLSWYENGWGKSNKFGAMPVGQRCLQQPATRRWTCEAQFPREILGTSVTFTDGVPLFLVSWQKHFQLDITSAFRFGWIIGTNLETCVDQVGKTQQTS